MLGKIRKLLSSTARWGLQSSTVLRTVGLIRLYWYVYIRKALRTQDSSHAYSATVSHNLKALSNFKLTRMRLLIDPLSVIEIVPPDSRVLVIGCRNEADLLLMVAKGFNPKRIKGVDLISYSPWVDCGDMHKLPYGDGDFDAVVCGWTLSYSSQPELAAREILRVCKKGGVVAVGVEYCSDISGAAKATGYAIEDDNERKLNSVTDILKLFGDGIKDVYFSHDAPLRISHTSEGVVGQPSSVAVVFSTRSN